MTETDTDTTVNVLLAGGGTAGHVNPLLATADALHASAAGTRVQLLALGTQTGLEAELVPAAGYRLAFIPRVPLPRRPNLDLLRLPAKLYRAVKAAEEAIAQIDADVVVGFGGYVSTPAYLAARRRKIPVVIHEQNARPGIANRLGARWAKLVALTFASTPLQAKTGQTQLTGLPLRPAIAQLVHERASQESAQRRRQVAARELGLRPELPTLLITGGSLGAQHLNEVAASAIECMPEDVQVLHLTGKGKSAPVLRAVEACGVGDRYHILEYLNEMEQAYACADMVLCRSGAGTVAELTALGLPALYVPLPIGNGEQRLNASDVVAAGGGSVIADADLTRSDICRLFAQLRDESALVMMSTQAASVGLRDGAEQLATVIISIAKSGSCA